MFKIAKYLFLKTASDLADNLAASLKKKNRREVDGFIFPKVGLATGHGLSPEFAPVSRDELRAMSYNREI